MLYACQGVHTLFTSQRERESKRERKRKREREKEIQREKERERERKREYLFLKGMTGALAPFSYQVLYILLNIVSYG
jgi:hypothetical protein